ncbi:MULTISPECIES: class Ib ribonucleoside-diphosphate reductase assembly flavoprotein NrdI [unclassified Streptococcus]|uniref:class Ib ribonucleoside-diphosphate reductase assembly flavoprotein NrdI n=1 Tax=unclassified Streptococcus TaxID=2608887 RepID=UPI00359E12CC
MKLVFFTITGQTRRFIAKLNMAEQALELTPSTMVTLDEEFILVCPTYEDGVDHIDDFLDDHKAQLKGLIGIGNRNFGPDFCHLAKRYATTYQVPLLYTLEFNGTPDDVEYVKGILQHES